MHPQRINRWQLFTAAAILTGIFVRFQGLGSTPLSDYEAGWAVNALKAANPEGLRSLVAIGPQPAYVLLTALLFKFLGATDFSARFWPALSGSLLLLAPLMLKKRVGRTAAAIMLVGLALDPGLVTISRLAGGPMLAVSCLTLALLAFWDRKSVAAGILAGIALLSGSAVFPGLIGLGLSAGLIWRKSLSQKQTSMRSDSVAAKQDQIDSTVTGSSLLHNFELRYFFLMLGSTLFILGTSFMQYPQGLAAGAQAAADYISGWAGASRVNPLGMAVVLLVYEPFAVLFAALTIFRWVVKKENAPRKMDTGLKFSAVSLIIFFPLLSAYPSRQISDLIWLSIPIWLLASVELRRSFHMRLINIVSALQAGLIIILGSLLWFAMVSPGDLTSSGSFSPLVIRFALIAGLISLGIFASILIALGWSTTLSRLGAVWGITAIAVITSVSSMWAASYLRANQPAQLWSPPPGVGQQRLFAQSLEELSKWNTGRWEMIQVVSVVDWPSLRWELRNFQNATFRSTLPVGDLPAVIITTPEQAEPSLSAAYRGQDFVWRTWPDWQGLIPEDLLRWLAFGEAPIVQEKIILWGRSDQFPGEKN